ncbi:hypothetical protein TNCV_5079491 [Trichonephila clavipes]|nr:hypothetical protein TNCV_5079491 [Trichonephila clavipes]
MYKLYVDKEYTPSGREIACRASTPQVRGSSLGLGKVDSTFYPFDGSINEHQACLETKHWEFRCRLTTRSGHLLMPLSAQWSSILRWAQLALTFMSYCATEFSLVVI